jgi:hypothetical protein
MKFGKLTPNDTTSCPRRPEPYTQRFENPTPRSCKYSSFTQYGTRSYERMKSTWLRFSVFLSLFRLRSLSSQRPRQVPSEFLQVHHALLIYIISATGRGSFNNLSGNQANYVRRTGLGSIGQLCRDGASKYARTTSFRPPCSSQAVPHP